MSFTTQDGSTLDFKPPGDDDPTSIPSPPDGGYLAKCSVEYYQSKKTGFATLVLAWTIQDAEPGNEKWVGTIVKDFFTFVEGASDARRREALKLAAMCRGLSVEVPRASSGNFSDAFGGIESMLAGQTHTIRLVTRGKYTNVVYELAA